jgi:hypothetical protein
MGLEQTAQAESVEGRQKFSDELCSNDEWMPTFSLVNRD